MKGQNMIDFGANEICFLSDLVAGTNTADFYSNEHRADLIRRLNMLSYPGAKARRIDDAPLRRRASSNDITAIDNDPVYGSLSDPEPDWNRD